MTDKKKCLIDSNKIGSRKRKSLFPWFRRQNTRVQAGEAQMLHSMETEDDLTQVTPRHAIYCPIFPARFNHEPCCVSQGKKRISRRTQ